MKMTSEEYNRRWDATLDMFETLVREVTEARENFTSRALDWRYIDNLLRDARTSTMDIQTEARVLQTADVD